MRQPVRVYLDKHEDEQPIFFGYLPNHPNSEVAINKGLNETIICLARFIKAIDIIGELAPFILPTYAIGIRDSH
jgi:hypothetical protein